MNNGSKTLDGGTKFNPSTETSNKTAPVAREASELGDGAKLSGGDNGTHKTWNWTMPGVSITLAIDYYPNLEYVVKDFIDESLEFIEDTITDIQRMRRRSG